MVHIKKRNLLKILIKTVYLKKKGGGDCVSFISLKSAHEKVGVYADWKKSVFRRLL